MLFQTIAVITLVASSTLAAPFQKVSHDEKQLNNDLHKLAQDRKQLSYDNHKHAKRSETFNDLQSRGVKPPSSPCKGAGCIKVVQRDVRLPPPVKGDHAAAIKGAHAAAKPGHKSRKRDLSHLEARFNPAAGKNLHPVAKPKGGKRDLSQLEARFNPAAGKNLHPVAPPKPVKKGRSFMEIEELD